MGRAAIAVGTLSWADSGFVQRWYPTGLAAERARELLGQTAAA